MRMQEIVVWRVVFNDMLGLALLIEKSFSDYLSYPRVLSLVIASSLSFFLVCFQVIFRINKSRDLKKSRVLSLFRKLSTSIC